MACVRGRLAPCGSCDPSFPPRGREGELQAVRSLLFFCCVVPRAAESCFSRYVAELSASSIIWAKAGARAEWPCWSIMMSGANFLRSSSATCRNSYYSHKVCVLPEDELLAYFVAFAQCGGSESD